MRVMLEARASRQPTGRVEIDEDYLGGEGRDGKLSAARPTRSPSPRRYRAPRAPTKSSEFAKYAYRYIARMQYLFDRRFNVRTILVNLAKTACSPQLSVETSWNRDVVRASIDQAPLLILSTYRHLTLESALVGNFLPIRRPSTSAYSR